jgi:hypothetical protein
MLLPSHDPHHSTWSSAGIAPQPSAGVNVLTGELIVALKQAIQAAPSDGTRALILSGTPGRFSDGLDVPISIEFRLS